MEKVKQLTLVVDEKLHHEIKRRATEQGLSMKEWLLVAIADRQQKEEDLNRKE